MKNSITILVVSMLAFLSLGCGGGGGASATQSSTNLSSVLPATIEKVAKSSSGSPVQYDF